MAPDDGGFDNAEEAAQNLNEVAANLCNLEGQSRYIKEKIDELCTVYDSLCKAAKEEQRLLVCSSETKYNLLQCERMKIMSEKVKLEADNQKLKSEHDSLLKKYADLLESKADEEANQLKIDVRHLSNRVALIEKKRLLNRPSTQRQPQQSETRDLVNTILGAAGTLATVIGVFKMVWKPITIYSAVFFVLIVFSIIRDYIR